MILIDTCVFLWMVIDQEQLSKKAIDQIRANANKICISAISAFEIGIKANKNLLKLPMPAAEWFAKATELHGIKVSPVTAEIALLATQLPELHRDPADRMIISTGMINNCPIISPDQHIKRYPKIRVIW